MESVGSIFGVFLLLIIDIDLTQLILRIFCIS